MSNVFQKVAVRKPSSNNFNLSHDKKLSCDMGYLIPVNVMDVLPGDSFKLKSEALIRFAPLIAPVMHRVTVTIDHFFVPNRLVWDNFGNFISPPQADSEPPAHPFVQTGVALGSLQDYFGLPAGAGQMQVNAIPFAAYQMIWNEYYRDQNLQEPVNYKLSNGNNSNISTLRRRSWKHDYFTAALPFAQKGAPIDLPFAVSGSVPLLRNNDDPNTVLLEGQDNTGGDLLIAVDQEEATGSNVPTNRLYVNLDDGETTGSGTINDLRIAIRTQEFLERQARGGSRYIEQTYMQFGVRSSDQRLDRPEFIGRSTSPVIISEVLQTSETGESTPQANMAGHGISANSGKTFRYYAEEHGYIISLMSITPDTAYQQGIPRHFSRMDIFDYAWPVLAHIGEQEVLNKELYYDADDGEVNDETFGYQPRYSEYRYIPSSVAGEFRTTLNFWHMARIFDERPQLNEEFIECNPTKRIFAVEAEDEHVMWCHVFNSVRARRKLPKYGTPTL